ncbi:Di-sulfide bridge nucleocytoplasmic transport domain-containing protein [Sporodiniella umbellata]|nr:Di-sulfide bridge nucleocytoplasmic transport domain-containing protein [Sporodiniella umbellata]
MYYDDSDAMEFEYTHPQLQSSFSTSSFLSSQPCFKKQNPFNSTQLFSKSIFDSQESADSVCSLISSFSLVEKEEKKSDKKSHSSPTSLVEEPLTAIAATTQTTEAVEVTEPNITEPSSPTSIHQHHAYNHHTPTFIYNQAPIPPVDPLAEKHSNLYYLMGLIKIGFSSIAFSILLYLFVEFTQFIRQDVASKIIEYESDELNRQLLCQQEYKINECASEIIRPALKTSCRDWEDCMFRPSTISKSKIFAETLAGIINAFSDNITLKATCLSVITLIGLLWSITSAITRPKEKNQERPQKTIQAPECKKLLLE